jgi:hypothetical protein
MVLRYVRRGLPASLAALLVVLAVAIPCAAAPIAVAVDPPVSGFCCDDTLSVYVTVDANAVDLRGFSLDLEFNPAIIQPVDVLPGDLMLTAGCGFFLDWLNAAAIGDSISVDAATLGCSMVGPGRILELRFVGVSGGTSPLSCRSLSMRDSMNLELDKICFSGAITYQEPIAVEEHPWSIVKGQYRGP